jgi:cytosine/adenosine deaminase-related metal-dependent hydrolase
MSQTLLRARRLVTAVSAPVDDAAVVIEKDKIAFAGPWHALPLPYRTSTVVDLGDATLLPGLVNTHTHLEHSALKGLTTPGLPFTEWVKEVMRQKSVLSLGDIRAGAKHGSEALVRGGTTTLADHAHPNSPALETPLRRILLWEVLGAHEGRARESLEAARQRVGEEGGSVSPHSLYAVHEEIVEEILHDDVGLRAIHVLESADEDQFFRRQEGPLAVYVQERGGDLAFPVSSPVQWLAANRGLNDRTLLVHANYLNPSEIAVLRGSGAFVIHCPGSHRFFGHKPFPLEDLRAAGVPVALGTDSLASNEDLSMLREMRLLRETHPSLSEDEILKMATLGGAAALGLETETGSVEAGKKADLIAVRGSVWEAESVAFSMVAGKILLNHV